MGKVVNTGLCSAMAVFVVCTIVQAGSSVCTHRQVGPERRRGRGSVPGGAGYDQYTGSAT